MFGNAILVFDIETITDIKAGSQLYQLDLAQDDTVQALAKLRRQESGSDFPRLPLHEIVCISGFWIEGDQFQLFSWSQENSSEVEILQRFVGIFEKKQPILVSWNGAQFDLPVIMYRCLYHGLSAPELFEQGDWNPQKRFNNYQNRYQARHTDLMDVLASFNLRNVQKLDDLAQIFGYPGKRGTSGYHVQTYVEKQQWQALTDYCEGDVLNTWLIYLRWALLRGFLNQAQHKVMVQHTISYLTHHTGHQSFLNDWKKTSLSTAFTAQDF